MKSKDRGFRCDLESNWRLKDFPRWMISPCLELLSSESCQLRKDGKANEDGVCKPNTLLSSSHRIGQVYPVTLKRTNKNK